MVADRPGQEGSVQYSQLSMLPLESTEVAHHGAEFPSTVVHRSLSRRLVMKGNTQLPQLLACVPIVKDDELDIIGI